MNSQSDEIRRYAAVVARVAEELNFMAKKMVRDNNMEYADKAFEAAVKCRFVVSELLP